MASHVPNRRHMPVLLFDGECGFCTAAVEWLARRLERRTRLLAWQRADLAACGVSREQAAASVWWIEPGGAHWHGAAAAAHALASCRPPWKQLGHALLAPGLRRAAAAAYWLVARVRRWLPGTTPACRRQPGDDVWPRVGGAGGS
jgi:predicted DCC family thiol-disulfide oxidoreductase YuxK